MTHTGHLPRISIAVPSFNQARFISETLQSLVDQQYPDLEVLVQDGGSTDGAIDIAQAFASRYPTIIDVRVQKDRGHANAVNLAFARSTGDILGYLNTDDTLLPGCLHRVASEIDPVRGRYIVFGRSIFTGEGSHLVGLEHPAEFRSHFEMLAVWKRGYNTISQPSTFWHRTVLDTCGGFDEAHNHGLDYLQWCRYSKKFHFHFVDALWSTYRMQPESVTANKTEEQWLAIMMAYSRMNWGPWWHPLRWRCEASYAAHRADRFMAWRALRKASQPTFSGRYGDGWIGPLYRARVAVPADVTRLVVTLEHHSTRQHPRVSPTLMVEGTVVDHGHAEGGRLSLTADVVAYRGKSCQIEVRTPEYFVPSTVGGGADERALSVLLVEERLQ
jgi:glycosyltransferase involved in cell wall biosynthesis